MMSRTLIWRTLVASAFAMFRRLRQTPRAVVILGVGLIALLAGLLALLRMVALERDDAQASLRAHDRVVIAYTQNALSARLAAIYEQATVSIEQALKDPLVPCTGCYYRAGDEQLLPRLVAGTAAEPGRQAVRAIYERLRSGRSVAGLGDYENLYRACAQKKEGSLVALLEHRARYVMPTEEEIASTLALLTDCQPQPPLARGLLREGIDVPGARRAEGLQPLVLRHMRKLSQKDADFVVALTLQISKSNGVKTSDFEARLRELSQAAVTLPNDTPPASLAVDGNGTRWYLVKTAVGSRGVALDLDGILAGVVLHMKKLKLLHGSDRIELRMPKSSAVTTHKVGLSIVSAKRRAAASAIHDRYMLKLLLLMLCGGMGLAVAALGLVLQQRRRRLLELKSEFVSGVSHELRTPLASMRIIAETLALRTAGNPGVRDFPQRLIRDIDGMVFLVENILSFNRLNKGRWQPRLDTIKLEEIVSGVCEEVRERTPRAVTVSPDLDGVMLDGDPELLRLLFRNLVTNAVAYNESDPAQISISARSQPRGGLEILFRDNGVGIAEEDRASIFHEFTRGAASAMARGSGLGLALCQRVMALHGGSIAVAQSSPEGTTFCLRFP